MEEYRVIISNSKKEQFIFVLNANDEKEAFATAYDEMCRKSGDTGYVKVTIKKYKHEDNVTRL